MGGEAGKMEGVTFDISNKHRLGYSELQLIQTMVNGVNTLCAMDLVLQKKKKCNIYFFFFCSTRSMAHRVFTPLTIVWISCSSEYPRRCLLDISKVTPSIFPASPITLRGSILRLLHLFCSAH